MKKIFFYTDVLPFLSKGDDAIEKLIHNLQIFRERSNDVHLVWHPWPGTEKYLEINDSLVLPKYQEIVRSFKNEGWGEIDDSDSPGKTKEVLLECDAYYGDPSELLYDAMNAGIPVMLQNMYIK